MSNQKDVERSFVVAVHGNGVFPDGHGENVDIQHFGDGSLVTFPEPHGKPQYEPKGHGGSGGTGNDDIRKIHFILPATLGEVTRNPILIWNLREVTTLEVDFTQGHKAKDQKGPAGGNTKHDDLDSEIMAAEIYVGCTLYYVFHLAKTGSFTVQVDKTQIREVDILHAKGLGVTLLIKPGKPMKGKDPEGNEVVVGEPSLRFCSVALAGLNGFYRAES